MDRRLVLLLVVVAMFGTVAVAGVGATTPAADHDIVHECAAEPPEDFAAPEAGNETIGWFDGFWYNEPLDIDASEGITEEELEKLSARTAARFEAMRCLPMETMPPVEIITRDEFANETAAQFANVSDRERQFDNAQFASLLTIGTAEDSVDVREDSRSVTVGGYYNFVEERIVVISDGDGDELMIDEPILAHELGHAIQDQHFDLETYHRPTKDLNNAKLGVIEGDVHLIEQEYLEHCEEDRWGEPCIEQDQDDTAGGASPPNWGLYFMGFQPYSDGPNFVDYIYTEGYEGENGWDAVNELYEDMPESSSQVITPETFGTESPADLEITSDPSGTWERLTNPTGPDYNVIGEGGMAAMFLGQTVERYQSNEFDAEIIPLDEIMNPEGVNSPFNYDIWPTDGWTGDRLYVYADEDNRTGSVWKTAWEDEEQRDEFLTAYELLAEDRGGERVDGYVHTWEFDGEYDMAVTLYPADDRLWIVTAPTVDELSEIYGGIELLEEEEENGDDTTTPPGDNGVSPGNGDDTITPPNGDDDPTPPADDTDDDTIPGFGPLAGALALLALVLWLRRTE